jgi:hypothetical protein
MNQVIGPADCRFNFQQPGKPLGGLRMEPHEDGEAIDGLPPQGGVHTLFGIH